MRNCFSLRFFHFQSFNAFFLNVVKLIRIDGASCPLKLATSKRANIGFGLFKGGLTSVSSRQAGEQ